MELIFHMKQNDFLFIVIGFIIASGLLSFITGEIQWPVFVGGLIGAIIAEFIRKVKRKRQSETEVEVEYDERINDHMKTYIINVLGISNLLLLIYLIISSYVVKQLFIKADYVILYLLMTLMIAFFIIPGVAKRK